MPVFENLVDLRLSLPGTADFRQFTEGMTKEAKCRLKHLHVCIMDQTGEAGNDDSGIGGLDVSYDDGVADGIPASGCIPPSNLQIKYPNQEHQRHVWDFVASCENLEFLSVTATHYLDLDQLGARKPKLGHLRALALKRIWVSVPTITALLDPKPSSQGTPRVNAISFESVKIHEGGTWTQFFKYLSEFCPSLACVNLNELTYFSTHDNFDLNLRLGDTSETIWSQDEEELEELRRLVIMLIKRAGGLDHYPKDFYDSILYLDDWDDEELSEAN